MSKTVHVLGIDPGSQTTGFGLVRVYGAKIEVVSYGLIEPPAKAEFNERIALIAAEFEILLQRLRPDVTVVERIFLGKNADSAFKLGHARGVIVASAIRGGSQVVEYATRKVKSGITGNGNAGKDQVQTVVNALLGIKSKMQNDASDALALAVYHARSLEVELGLQRQYKRMQTPEVSR